MKIIITAIAFLLIFLSVNVIAEEIPKSDVPSVELFVMSFCPFCNPVEEAIYPITQALNDKAKIELRYVIYTDYQEGSPSFCLGSEDKYCSMHGIQELHENVRELCVFKYDKAHFWSYLMDINKKCDVQNADACWEAVGKENGVDTEKIKTCEKEEAIELLKKEVELDKKYNIDSSPVLVINGHSVAEFSQNINNRNSESLLKFICSAFNEKPKECEKNSSPEIPLETPIEIPSNPIEIPSDMHSCLNNQGNYWDQETNSCHAGFNDGIILPSCSDLDNGRNYYKYAHTYGFRSAYADNKDKRIRTGGGDACSNFDVGQLIEHHCDENGFIQTEYFQCPNGCENGACVSGDSISEKITCKFEGKKKEQQCYLAGQWGPEDKETKFCNADDSSSCTIIYSGDKGSKVTWKSTCGQYQYTTQDGNDEIIYFKCEEGETNITEIKDSGFKSAYWQCYDGAESKSEDKDSCKSSDLWQKYANDFCKGHCYNDNSKCGVNTFSVSNECYLDEEKTSLCNPGEDIQICCSSWAKKNNKITPICVGSWNIEGGNCIHACKSENVESNLVCKDSCPSDNKCYPFGYRKLGMYCSDEGKFIGQLKEDNTCDNNFECSSNVCISGRCVSEGLLQKILNWFKNLFG